MAMAESTITVKYQTTVPKEVREKLGVGPGGVLKWEILGDCVQVATAEPAFLRREGRVKVGPGDPVEDVRKARKLMGLMGL
jgi:AbrB family looped-hinge helix DNA binding protein